jgi:hypothetical protein
VANHPINDLVSLRLISISDLAAETLELWPNDQYCETALARLTQWHSGLEQGFCGPSLGLSSCHAITTKRTVNVRNAGHLATISLRLRQHTRSPTVHRTLPAPHSPGKDTFRIGGISSLPPLKLDRSLAILG